MCCMSSILKNTGVILCVASELESNTLVVHGAQKQTLFTFNSPSPIPCIVWDKARSVKPLMSDRPSEKAVDVTVTVYNLNDSNSTIFEQFQ